MRIGKSSQSYLPSNPTPYFHTMEIGEGGNFSEKTHCEENKSLVKRKENK